MHNQIAPLFILNIDIGKSEPALLKIYSAEHIESVAEDFVQRNEIPMELKAMLVDNIRENLNRIQNKKMVRNKSGNVGERLYQQSVLQSEKKKLNFIWDFYEYFFVF